MPDATSLLPPNSTRLERAVERADAQLSGVAMVHDTLWNPWNCPAEFLPFLAWSVSVDTWDSNWPERIKRARIASSFQIQRHKGTAKSIADLIASFGGQMKIREWWQMTPQGEPHTFSLFLTISGDGGQESSAEFVHQIVDAVNRTKPVRSHFTFTQGIQADSQVGTVAGAQAAVYRRLTMTGD